MLPEIAPLAPSFGSRNLGKPLSSNCFFSHVTGIRKNGPFSVLCIRYCLFPQRAISYRSSLLTASSTHIWAVQRFQDLQKPFPSVGFVSFLHFSLATAVVAVAVPEYSGKLWKNKLFYWIRNSKNVICTRHHLSFTSASVAVVSKIMVHGKVFSMCSV